MSADRNIDKAAKAAKKVAHNVEDELNPNKNLGDHAREIAEDVVEGTKENLQRVKDAAENLQDENRED